MHYAIERETGKKISAIDFEKKHGHKTTEGNEPSLAECPYCHRDLYLRQGTKTLHFWHGSSEYFCPSKEPFGRSYISLTPNRPDPVHAAELRRQFKENWQLHYKELERIVPFLHIKEFISILDEAHKKDIFAYTELQIEDMPYVLALTLDFVPVTSKGKARHFWFRFWYSEQGRSIEELWIRGARKPNLVRASFVPPTSPARFPDYDRDLVKDTEILRKPFLEEKPPQLPSFILETVTKWFSKHPTF
ncbi:MULTISPECIES: hypothetical protein [Deefgea]|uniref:Competence protein CoiA n=1 Tax=Deefgea chitinilytica TaxID=570276 RepID=A0ABS2CFZ1_9NEIS|nr:MULTISPECIES: hypothetical protein [Deefgea]MBM5573012.1 hypothetical protein [Deefgea chitinilytica]MBM9890248.1 hypothetical protein [Deefgea sp. CFH1-16]